MSSEVLSVGGAASADPVDDVAHIQRRTLRLLFASQVLGGIGLAIGFSVGALLAAEMAGIGVSGLAQSAAVVGAALLAIPATHLVRGHGRRASLVAAYLVASAGGALVVSAAMWNSVPLLFVGFFFFGGATTASLQARYGALDLAPDRRRARHLAIVVWATTLGAVAGPNLAPIAGAALAPVGIPTLAGPFLFSALCFVCVAAMLLALLRPDPMVVARGLAPRPADGAESDHPRGAGMRVALGYVLTQPAARLGVASMAIGHLVMVGVMAMTPVHIRSGGHGPEHTLRIVGIVLSLHVLGMFAFAPLTGWLADRFGRRPVIGGGIVLLLLACGIAGTAGPDSHQLGIGLMVLGLGWSGTMVAGSTLLSESVPADLRPSAQGLSDLVMGLAGASAGAASGLIVQWWGYPSLALLAALATIPLVVLSLHPSTTRSRSVATP